MVKRTCGVSVGTGGDPRDPGVTGQVLDLGELLPPAEVLGKPARIVGGAGRQGERARAGEYRLDATGGGGHLGRVQGGADADHAVPGEGRDHLVIRAYGFHTGTVALATLMPEGGPQRGRPSVARGIQVGDKAPDFTLPSQTGEQVRLQDRLGERVVVLYFYPKDNTSGCTAEACAFRDSYETFTDAGAEVIGVSSDSADKHAGFASKHRLPFTLLADQGGRVRKAYSVPAVLGFLPGRVTYVIDRTGTVRHVFSSMTNIDGHVSEALEVVRQLQAEQPALRGLFR